MLTTFLRKIIWAVDGLESPDQQRHAHFLVGALSRATGLEVRPVSILNSASPGGVDVPVVRLNEAYRALAEKNLAKLTDCCDLEKLLPSQILENTRGSLRSSAELLAAYAESDRADAIVVATHSRRGLERAFLGSFSETLLLSSKLPIFSVNPETQVRERISRIVMPTLFQESDRAHFEQVVAFAAALGASLSLYYKEPPVPVYGTNENYVFHDALTFARGKLAEDWKLWAQRHGVAAEVELDNVPGVVTKSILQFAADRNADLIAMSSTASRGSVLLLGSTAREVVRAAPCPVWTARISESTQ